MPRILSETSPGDSDRGAASATADRAVSAAGTADTISKQLAAVY